MKKLFLFIFFGLLTISLKAQPGDDEVKKIPMSKGAITTRVTSPKGNTHTTITEKWYMRTVESKWKTDYPGIFRWERNEYRFNYLGGKWTYARTYQNSSWYEGIPNPSEAEVVKLINSQLSTYLSTAGRIIGKPESIKLAADPKWNWESMKKTTCITEAIYTEKIDEIGNAQKVKQKFAVSMFKDKDDKNAPFVRFFSVREGEAVVLEKTKYEAEKDESPFQKAAASSNQTIKEKESLPEEPQFPKYNISDAVTVNWNGQGKDFYKGKIVKNDPYDANRYFVEFETIQSAWIHAKHISKNNNSQPASSKNAETNSSTSFSIGDKVSANWKGSGKWLPGKIEKADDKYSNRFFIKYDNGSQEWTTTEYIKKE